MTPRDYSALYRPRGDLFECVICGQSRTAVGREVHSEYHLARCEAVVDDYAVIPTSAAKESGENRPAYSWTRKLDPILRRLVRAEQRKLNRSPRG